MDGTLSSTELKDLLIKIKEHRWVIQFFPDGISLADNIYFSRDGYVYVRRGRKLIKYTLEKFLIHYMPKMSRKEVWEAVRHLRDLSLLIKKEEGSLKIQDVLKCRNIVIRRYLLQDFSYEQLIKNLKCRIIDREGENELIMIPLRGDEPILLVRVKDPSTGFFYLLRVPPNIRTCKEAIAWTFGLQPQEYNPLKET